MDLTDKYNVVSSGTSNSYSYDGRLYHTPEPLFKVSDNESFLGIDRFQVRFSLITQHLRNLEPDSSRGEAHPGVTITEEAYDDDGNPLYDYTFTHANIVTPAYQVVYSGYTEAPTIEEVAEDLDGRTNQIWLQGSNVTEREAHYTAEAYKDKFGAYPDDYSVLAGIGEGENYDEVNPGIFVEAGWNVNHGKFYDGQYWAGVGLYDNSYNPERFTDKYSASVVGTFFPEDLTLSKDNLTLSSGIFAGAASYPKEVIEKSSLPHIGNRLGILGGFSFKGEYHLDSGDNSVFLQADVAPAYSNKSEMSGFVGLSTGVTF